MNSPQRWFDSSGAASGGLGVLPLTPVRLRRRRFFSCGDEMQRIPLYATPPLAAVEVAESAATQQPCDLCDLGSGVETPCMPPEGRAGGLLVITGAPGRDDDIAGRRNVGRVGGYLRRLIRGLWPGPIAYDSAVRCAPGQRKVKPVALATCRRYVARTFRDVAPSRVLLLGPDAFRSVLGRCPPPMSVMDGGHTWIGDVPCFLLPYPVAALRNRFLRRGFEAALQHALVADPEPPPLLGTAFVVETEFEAVEACRSLVAASWIGYDTETWGEFGEPGFTVLVAALSVPGSHDAWVWDELGLQGPERGPLAALLRHQDTRLVGHNEAYDQVATYLGLDVRRQTAPWLCTRLARRLLDATVLSRLEYAAELVGMGGHKAEADVQVAAEVKRIVVADAVTGIVRPNPKAYAFAGVDRVTLLRYCARDTVATTRLGVLLESRFEAEPEIAATWRDLGADASWAVAHMSRWGVAMSRQRLEVLGRGLRAAVAEAAAVLSQQCLPGSDTSVNPRSTKQLRQLLFEVWGLKSRKKTKKAKLPSTDKEVVAYYAVHGPPHAAAYCVALLEHRRLEKLLSTYVDSLLSHIGSDGRVHPSYNLDGAESGRMSSQTPNLLNIPRKYTVEGKALRDAFVAEPGNTLIQGDLSQAELRVAAALSGDEVMSGIYHRGEDIHLETARMIASQVWGIAAEDVGSVERTKAKTFNFAVAYGAGDNTLAAQIGCGLDEVAAIRVAVMGRFTGLARYKQRCIADARRTGVVWTRTADGKPRRRRPVHGIGDADEARQAHAERAAFNTIIQGTASDLCLAAVVAVVRWVIETEAPVKVVLSVYDSIMLEVRDDFVDAAAAELRRLMEATPMLGIPIVADIEIGKSWGSLQEVAPIP